MPVEPPFFDADDVECLRRWISQLPPPADVGTSVDAAPEAAPAPTCPTGQTECVSGGTASCKTLASDPANCGACGRTCSAGQSCIGGQCQCPSGTASCSGSCVDLKSNASHCGACGIACGTGTVCSNGTCVKGSCPTGTVNCSGACV